MEGEIAQATIKREVNHWFITIVCHKEVEIKPIPVTKATMVGLDVGLLNLVVLSTGEVIENPRFLKMRLDKLIREQRKLSQKKKGSKNYCNQVEVVAKCHVKIKNARKDYLQKNSTQINKNHGGFAVEDLSTRNLMQNGKLALHIADASWYSFLSMIEYKALWAGKPFIKVSKNFPSSKSCSSCHAKQDMPLNVRTFKCESCGLEMDRDLNASLNLQAAGLAVLACGVISTS